MKTTHTPKEKPILFSGPMVRAILDGRKTQTRRINKQFQFHRDAGAAKIYNLPHNIGTEANPYYVRCPYGQPGDRLWVKETFTVGEGVIYRAEWSGDALNGLWTPSIFMPRKLSRITLEITTVRVERLQDITEEDAIAEGCDDFTMDEGVKMWSSAVEKYGELWESINGHGSWNANPWVWVIEFRKL